MPNTLGIYDPVFYAQSALIQLEKRLGMANAVFRGYDKSPQQKGSTISIRRPGVFTAQSMPIATAADITTDTVSIVLNQWFGVVMGLTDKELNYTQEEIIREHIRPAAVAIADQIDLSLNLLYKDVPHIVTAADPGAITDFTSLRQAMFDNKVPDDSRSLEINGEREADYLALQIFHQANTSSDGAETQRSGFLGKKFNFDVFTNQNVQTHSDTPISAITQAQVNATALKGATTINIKDSDGTLAGALAAGDTFSVVTAGVTYRYAVTATSTAAANVIPATVTPAVRFQHEVNDNITIDQPNTKKMNLAFHRNAFALAMAPLSDLGQGAGARIGIAVDPITNLALRSRMWYDGKEAKLYVGLDALWGVKTLDGDLAARLQSP